MSKRIVAIALAVVLATVVIVVGRSYRRHDPMPAGAKRLMPMADPSETVVDWIDANTILVHNKTGIDTVDIRTGARAVPPGIKRAIALHPELTVVRKYGRLKSNFSSIDWSLSPDKKWLVAYSSSPAGAAYQTEWVASKLDGTDVRVGPGLEAQTFWLPDSSGWISLDDGAKKSDDARVTLYKLANHRIVSRTLVASTDDIATDEYLAMTAPDKALMFFDGNHRDYDVAGMVQITPQGTNVLATYGDPVGGGSDYYPDDALLSPDGSKIAWSYLGANSLAHLYGTVPTEDPSVHDGIVITNATNGNRRVLIPDYSGYYLNPRWMPDSRHLSLIHNKALWSVPVY